METSAIFKGHIIHCHDLDSGDRFNVEVLINDSIDTNSPRFVEIYEKSAKRNEIVSLSGNTFEFEYIQPSGKAILKTATQIQPSSERVILKTVTTKVISPIDKESEELLDQREMY